MTTLNTDDIRSIIAEDRDRWDARNRRLCPEDDYEGVIDEEDDCYLDPNEELNF